MNTAIPLYLIVGIDDCDTLTARCGELGAYHQEHIRIAAIDARGSRQPFGQRSRQSLAELCLQHQARITEKGHDRYQCMLAYVECRRQDVAQQQVRTDMVWVDDTPKAMHLCARFSIRPGRCRATYGPIATLCRYGNGANNVTVVDTRQL
ncbi:thermonuclease family protein [Comamonas odontotermitis]|uniref:thermonuclease family protein n=1 Tax=Comamonas odontotermitis TaxID=379895 RepID=UPI003751B68F